MVVERQADSSENYMAVEVLAASNHKAEICALRRSNDAENKWIKKFQAGDLVPVAKRKTMNTTIKWPAFFSKLVGPCHAVRARHP